MANFAAVTGAAQQLTVPATSTLRAGGVECQGRLSLNALVCRTRAASDLPNVRRCAAPASCISRH